MGWPLAANETPALWSTDWWQLLAWRVAVWGGIALAITIVGRWWVRRLRRKTKETGDDQLEGRRLRRVSTVAGILVGVLEVVAWFIVVSVVLSTMYVPLGPLFASAGVVGVALGFGAQAVVRDTLAGFFIALEGQFDVGDVLDLQSTGGLVSGTVEGFTLRVTAIRQFDGTLSIVPNGNITITSNKTRGWGRAIVDVRVALAEDPDHVREVLDELLTEVAGEDPFRQWLRKPPHVLGVTQLTDTAQVIRIVAETQPSRRADMERELRARVARRIAERGVKVPG